IRYGARARRTDQRSNSAGRAAHSFPGRDFSWSRPGRPHRHGDKCCHRSQIACGIPPMTLTTSASCDMSTAPPLIESRDVGKSFFSGESMPAVVLRGISLSIGLGVFLSILEATGSGKSPFMNILGYLDKPTSGTYVFGGQATASLSRDDLAGLRRDAFGFVF